MKQALSVFLAIVMLSSFLSGCKNNPSVSENTVPETTAPETTAPETTAPETTAPETTAPETTAPEIAVPSSDLPYLENISRADQPIYAGPGYEFDFVGTIQVAGIYTITEEVWDADGHLWGKLKSGMGWVNLTYSRSANLSPGASQTTTECPYLENIPYADQSIFAGPSYDFGFVGTVQVSGIYTITEEILDSEGNLWGKLKSGMGWVDLSDIRSSGKKLEPITANFADSTLISSGNYHHCIADTSAYMVQIAFRAAEPLTDISFYSLSWLDGYQKIEDLFYLKELNPDKPLVADVAFPGDLSMYGISFTDNQGTTHYYCVSTSGRNGSLVFLTYTPG